MLISGAWSACSDENKRAASTHDTVLENVSADEIADLLNAYKGKKALLVNVWATWCGPCVEELPYILELRQKYRDRLKVILISADFESDRERAIRFLQERNVDFTTYFKASKDEAFIKVLSEEWSGALPYTKMIAKNGEVVSQWGNKADYKTFEQEILKTINHK